MTARPYKDSGVQWPLTPASDLEVGTIVDLGGGVAGVVDQPMVANKLGDVTTAGSFIVKKKNDYAITRGMNVEYSTANGQAEAGTSFVIGKAMEAAAETATEVKVLINNRNP